MNNSSVLSIMLLISIPSSKLLAMDGSAAGDNSEPTPAQAHRIMDEALAKMRQEQPQFQEQAAPTNPGPRATLPTSNPQTSANRRFGCGHSHSPMGARLAAMGNPMFEEIFDLISHMKENPFKELTETVKKADTTLNTVLAHYRALRENNDLQTPEALDTFKKEKEEFNNAGDAAYEFLAKRSEFKSLIKLYMQHPATTRLHIKVIKETTILDRQDDTTFELVPNIAALKMGLDSLKAKADKLSDSSSSDSDL